MAKRYDDEFKARAVRLVTDHAEEYDTRTACISAVAKRLRVSYESLCRRVNQAEVDIGQRDGVATDVARENSELKRRKRELEEPSCLTDPAPVGTCAVGHRRHRDAGWLLRARRARSA